MNRMSRVVIGLFLSAAGAVPAWADVLAVDYTHNRLMRFSHTNGALIDPNYLQFDASVGEPFDVVQVGDELWVSDVLLRQVVRYSLDGSTRLGSISGFVGAAYGMEYVPQQNAVFLVVGRGGNPDDVHRIDVATHTIVSTFQASGGIDVVDAGGSLLVSDEERDVINRYAYDGTPLGRFVDVKGATGLRYPSQMAWQDADSLAVGCGGSALNTAGVAIFGDTGSVEDVWHAPDGAIGLAVLENGRYLISLNDAGYVSVFDPATGLLTRVGPEDSRGFYMSRVTIPSPAALSLLAMSGLAAVRRRG